MNAFCSGCNCDAGNDEDRAEVAERVGEDPDVVRHPGQRADDAEEREKARQVSGRDDVVEEVVVDSVDEDVGEVPADDQHAEDDQGDGSLAESDAQC